MFLDLRGNLSGSGSSWKTQRSTHFSSAALGAARLRTISRAPGAEALPTAADLATKDLLPRSPAQGTSREGGGDSSAPVRENVHLPSTFCRKTFERFLSGQL